MSTRSWMAVTLLVLALGASRVVAQGPNLGMPISESEIGAWDITVWPDGSGLPPGSGTAEQGARIFAATIRHARQRCPETSIEVLIPDFQGDWQALATVMEAGPDILNHNIETVPRLYSIMRPQAKHERSLELLDRARQLSPAPTKSGMMLGAGEERHEVEHTLRQLADVGCAILTLGQYLSPSSDHVPVARFLHPDEFDELGEFARTLGFNHVESGPMVRSSYHAEQQVTDLERRAVRDAAQPAHDPKTVTQGPGQNPFLGLLDIDNTAVDGNPT